MAKNFPLTKTEALIKLQKYCAYQDRCHQEVRYKLLSLKVYGDELEQVIADLIEDKFLDEERFACSYARGKFGIKKWGRMRIIRELKKRAISDYCIRKAMKEIDADDYLIALDNLMEKKLALLKTDNPYERKQKLVNYAFSRGYEADLAWQAVDKILATP